MKKHNTGRQSPKQAKQACLEPSTMGVDLGDRTSCYCVLNGTGEVVEEGKVATTKTGLVPVFGARPRCRIALEVGTHSPWVSRLLSSWGHEVIVANARQVKLISQSSRKDDRLDAQTLARLARADPQLLRPIRHRSEAAQLHLMTIRVRAGLVEARTALVNTARGLAQAIGERLPACGASQWSEERIEEAELPEAVRETLRPLLQQVATLTAQIHKCDETIEQIARKHYPETELLRQVSGVGNLIALTFVLTVEDRERFQKSRDVGCYVGCVRSGANRARASRSCESPKKAMSTCASCWCKERTTFWAGAGRTRTCGVGVCRLAARGGKNQKKRAIVAVARKLGILLHRLWVTSEVYEPLRHSLAGQGGKQAA